MDSYPSGSPGGGSEHELETLKKEAHDPSAVNRIFGEYRTRDEEAYGVNRTERGDNFAVHVPPPTEKRETWSNPLEFFLSLLGYSVGLTNFWRFPYLCYRNGGAAFLYPYFIVLVMCGVPLVFLEIAVGQFAAKNCREVWIACPLFKGVGIGMLIFTGISNLYSTLIIAWTLYYLANSFRKTLPWTICIEAWNTAGCYTDDNANAPTSHGTDMLYDYNRSYSWDIPRTSPESEYWEHVTRQSSSRQADWETLNWQMVICLFVAWMLVFLCIMKGVKSIGKVMYVTALLPYILMTILLIRALTLPGSKEGISYYLMPDKSKMKEFRVWQDAALQVFYSLGIGMGPLMSMASYNKFNSNCMRDGIIVPLISQVTSVYCGFVVFAILGFLAHDMGVSINSVVSVGLGLTFNAIPQALARLPAPHVWSALSFLLLLAVALDTIFIGVWTVLTAIVEWFPWLRKRQLLALMAGCMAMFVLGCILFLIQDGIYVLTLLDIYVWIFALPIIGILECIIFGWIYGANRLSRDIEMMIGRGIQSVFVFLFRLSWCFVTPIVLVILQIYTLKSHFDWAPGFGSYQFPVFAQAIGWLVALLPILPIPVVMVYRLWRGTRNATLMQALRTELSPAPDWQPNSEQHREQYHSYTHGYSHTYRRPFLQRIKNTVFG